MQDHTLPCSQSTCWVRMAGACTLRCERRGVGSIPTPSPNFEGKLSGKLPACGAGHAGFEYSPLSHLKFKI